MKTIQQCEAQGKNVLVRVDFNVNLSGGDVRQRFKMQAAKDTVETLLANGARTVTLCTHLGRPEGRPVPELSLRQITDDIARILGYDVLFVEDSVGEAAARSIAEAPEGSVLLLENVRFHAEEEANDESFARLFAEPFDAFVNDAFSVSHRAHVSTVGVAKNIPSYAGIYLEKEIDILSIIKKGVESPSVAIVGGSKIATKLPLIEAFSKTFDVVLVGGKVANEMLDGGIEVRENVVLPHDFEGDRFDIGPETRQMFIQRISMAKTIVWNGPLGKFEEGAYAQGTFDVAQAIAASSAFSVIGGGESIEVLENLGMIDQVGFVSTGGGAMMDYLTGESMPGLDALK